MSKSKKSLLERVKPEILDIDSYSVPGLDCSVRLDGNESPFEAGHHYQGTVSRTQA